jgi:3-hydroxybutyryl-CoA dehydrogenase
MPGDPLRNVTVIGAGTMGRGIAQVSLTAGFKVTVNDVSGDAMRRCGAAVMRGLVRTVGDADARRIMESFTTCASLEEAVASASIVIEAATENESVKLDIFRRVAAAVPAEALLATNTSTMSVTTIARAANEPTRVIGMHFFNPVHRMKLVEIITGEHTADATLAAARNFVSVIGKDSIVVRDVPGFVTSRLGLLLGNAAMRLVEEQIASAADVDKAMRLGYGHPMGPLELADLVGLDARLNNLRSLAARTGDPAYSPPDILVRLVAEGRLGRKSGSGFFDYPSDSVGGPT